MLLIQLRFEFLISLPEVLAVQFVMACVKLIAAGAASWKALTLRLRLHKTSGPPRSPGAPRGSSSYLRV